MTAVERFRAALVDQYENAARAAFAPILLQARRFKAARQRRKRRQEPELSSARLALGFAARNLATEMNDWLIFDDLTAPLKGRSLWRNDAEQDLFRAAWQFGNCYECRNDVLSEEEWAERKALRMRQLFDVAALAV